MTSKTEKAAPKPGPARSRVLIVEDHPMVREGLADVLNQQPDLCVTGMAGSVNEALDLIPRARPDIAIVDISLGGRSGLELIKDIRADHPGVKMLAFSMHDESIMAERAFRLGASGYVMKEQPIEVILEAVRTVIRGGIHLSKGLSQHILDHLVGTDRKRAGDDPLTRLSDRELEVFDLISRNRSVAEIAESMQLSRKTVEHHRRNIRVKLRLHNAVALQRYASEWAKQSQR